MTILPTLLMILSALSPQQETNFQSGLEAYWKGDYANAAAAFERLSREQPNVYAVWYNYGTSLGALGQTGKSVYALERALLLKPSDEDAMLNLALIKRRSIDALSETQQEDQLILPAVERDSSSLFRQYSTFTLNLSFGVCWLLFLVALVAARKASRARHRTIGFFFTLVFFLLSLGVATLRLGRSYWVDQSVKAIVVAPLSHARQGPGLQYRSVVRILDGVKVSILGEEKGWTLIEVNAGRTAWIKSQALAKFPAKQ